MKVESTAYLQQSAANEWLGRFAEAEKLSGFSVHELHLTGLSWKPWGQDVQPARTLNAVSSICCR